MQLLVFRFTLVLKHGRSTAASDDLDELTENLTEMIEELDDYLLWIERKGSQADLSIALRILEKSLNDFILAESTDNSDFGNTDQYDRGQP